MTHIADKNPLTALRDDVSVLLKAFVHLADRVVIDRDIGGHAAHRRQLVAREIIPGSDEVDETVLELKPNGNAGRFVKLEQVGRAPLSALRRGCDSLFSMTVHTGFIPPSASAHQASRDECRAVVAIRCP